jgi:hypothetical protein
MGSITGKHQGDERNEAGLHIRSAEEKKKDPTKALALALDG